MIWYAGNIAEAVAESKKRNAIFVVFVEGEDDNTRKLLSFINDDVIRNKLESQNFVSIKIRANDDSYMQFASIYQIVPVPSIFFIGKTGTPLEIATGVTATAEELNAKIENVLSLFGTTTPGPTSSASLIAREQQSSVVSQSPAATASLGLTKSAVAVSTETADVSKAVEDPSSEPTTSKRNEEASGEPAEASATNDQDENDDVVELRKKLEDKRRQRIEEEAKLEKESEIRRREDGRNTQNLREWQRDQDLKSQVEQMRRDRLEQAKERERILAQIAGDRAEAAQRRAMEAQKASKENAAIKKEADEAKAVANSNSSRSDTTRLQFRFPNGDHATQVFDHLQTLQEVRTFLSSQFLDGMGIRNFILATTYPKRDFTTENETQTLKELGLCPSAVILVISREPASGPSNYLVRSGGFFNVVNTIVMAILSPVFTLYNYVMNIRGRNSGSENSGAHKRENEDQSEQLDAAKRRNLDRFTNNTPELPSTSRNSGEPFRRYGGSGNVHRLSDNRKDSDDENATWNGNSTQQQ